MSIDRNDIAAFNHYVTIIKDLHTHLSSVKRFPSGDQTLLINEFFGKHKMIILAQCGRDAGKTEDVLYITWRFALTHPASEIYVICPEKLQGKKIYWNSLRLPNYGPQKYVAEKLKSELRIIFTNESSITVDGCENYDALRGIKPALVVYDEKQHHTRYFDEEVMQPNLSRGNVSLIAVGTPPKRFSDDYIQFRENILEKVSENHPKYSYIELPTWANPRADRAWLAEKKRDLIKRGRLNVWLREYEGKMVFDTENAILPFWSRVKHFRTRAELQAAVSRDLSKLLWYAIYDPGTSTCFAVLFLAVNPYTSEVFVLDEIYETRRGENTAMKIWARSDMIKERWYGRLSDWVNIYDIAAAWFVNEVLGEYHQRGVSIDFGFLPSNKERAAKPDEGRAGESVLNELMDATPQLFFVNDECKKFCEEIESYITDDAGKYPKTFDHLIDDLFYWVNTTSYTIAPQGRVEEGLDIDSRPRYESFASLVAKKQAAEDWASDIPDDIYDTGEYEWH